MKAVLVCKSKYHGNTKKVADVIAGVLQARVVDPADITAADLSAYDVVGFGSGIHLQKFYPELLEYVAALPTGQRGKAFVFASSGFKDSGPTAFSAPLVKLLQEKGFEVIDTFSSRALDTFAPFKIFGGIRKGRPNAADLDAAREFAAGLLARHGAIS
ncbi:flavodoxin family protein [Nocardia brasiliensis]